MIRRILLPLVLLTLVLLSFSVRSSVSMTPVTCSAPLSALGQPSHLTCFFQRDLNGSNKQIMVVRHSFEAPNDDLGKDVLTCTRRVHSHALTCKAKDGYILDGEISDRLTLHIPSATNDTAGQYLCHVIPPDGCVAFPCSLAVYENQEMFPPQSEPNQKQDTISLEIKLLLTIYVCTVFLLASCIIMLIFQRRRLRRRLINRRRLWNCTGDNNEDADQLSQSEKRVESISLTARETTDFAGDTKRLEFEEKRGVTTQLLYESASICLGTLQNHIPNREVAVASLRLSPVNNTSNTLLTEVLPTQEPVL